MADSAFTLMPRYGTLTELNNNLNKINNGDLCFTTDSNQEFIKIDGVLSPVLGIYKTYEVNLSGVIALQTLTIPNLDKAVISICSDDDTRNCQFDFTGNDNTLTIRKTASFAHQETIHLKLYVQYNFKNEP